MRALLLLALLLGPGTVHAAGDDLSAYSYRPRIGGQVPIEAPLVGAAGERATLGAMMAGKPTILALGYYRCPNLCGVLRDDLFSALARTNLVAGRDYTLISLSIDPAEGPADAAAAKRADLARFPVANAERAWRFATGAGPDVAAIERAVGFRSRFDAALKQFIHPTGLVFLTPSGSVSNYLLGVGYSPRDITSSIAQADQGTLAGDVTPVLLLCFHFDPTTGRYSLAVFRLLELGAGLTVITLGATLLLAFRRDRPT